MKVKALKNRGEFSPLVIKTDPEKPLTESNYVSSSEWFSTDGNTVGYSLTVGREYTVYAIITVEGKDRFLIIDDDGLPGYFPWHLFDSPSGEIFCDAVSSTHSDFCVFGADELSEYSFIVGIIGRDPLAIRELLEYKKRME